MTRRQICFHIPETNTYYVSEEYNGDREEFEMFGMKDTCTHSWEEILDEFKTASSLPDFLQALHKVAGYYKSALDTGLPGVRIKVVHSPEQELDTKDETYCVISGTPGIFLMKEYSINVGGVDN